MAKLPGAPETTSTGTREGCSAEGVTSVEEEEDEAKRRATRVEAAELTVTRGATVASDLIARVFMFE